MKDIISNKAPKKERPKNWYLKSSKGLQFFQSHLLLKFQFDHAFFTRNCWTNRAELLRKSLNWEAKATFLDQIHSDKILEIPFPQSKGIESGDALFTQNSNQSLWIYTADCIPILLADKKLRTVAACHSGLKGLQLNILGKTIEKLKLEGSFEDDILIVLGPGISISNYQVSMKDIELLNKRKSHFNSSSNQSINDMRSFFKADKEKGKALLDLQMAIKMQALNKGIKPSHISINRLCTFKYKSLFNSWRRDKGSDRQWTCIKAN